MSSNEPITTLETAVSWAYSGRGSDKVYRFIFLHPNDFFTIPNGRKWPIAHQIIYNGDIKLLQRILVLFSDQEIDIRTLSKDNKTLLDVADERKSDNPDMFKYVKHLFLQDDFIRAAKENNWELIRSMINENSELINQKPPYSTYFLLHYVVISGDKNFLQELLKIPQIQTNVISIDNETPQDLADRLKKTEIYSILSLKTQDQPVLYNLHTRRGQSITSTSIKQNSSLETSSSKTKSPCIGFEHLLLEINADGEFIIEKQNSFPILPTQFKENLHIEPIDDKNLKNAETPITPSSKEQIKKNFTCFLTGELFVDPVIASDGQTYERDAILEWIDLYHYSPITGETMNSNVRENTEIKQTIQSLLNTK